MSSTSLFRPVLDPGIDNPNFFEGRLLTGRDLREEQAANRERQRLLGRAIGKGVVEGLMVTLEPAPPGEVRTTVAIEAGIAINGDGQVLRLKKKVTGKVVPPSTPPEPSAGLFEICEEKPEPTVPAGRGIYVLVASPASGYRGRAPKSGLGTEGTVIGCGDRYVVEGVAFRLEPLLPEALSGIAAGTRAHIRELVEGSLGVAERSLLRNLVAHACFGTQARAAFAVDPFARTDHSSLLASYGALDDMERTGRLDGCDVPLALLLWTTGGIAFLDVWSVRRRPNPVVPSRQWPTLFGQRSLAEAEARFLQFQMHMEAVLGATTRPQAIEARSYFRYLPPAGILSFTGSSLIPGIDFLKFFNKRTFRRPVFINGARLERLLAESCHYPAIDLDDPGDAESPEMVWLYVVRENAEAIDGVGLGLARGRYLLFASGHMPFYGQARFDVSRWNYSNYGP